MALYICFYYYNFHYTGTYVCLQDPLNPMETVIIIRSLVPGGAAQLDGRLVPGDRLMFVNNVRLENASLDEAVQALKGAPRGRVLLGVAKPLPLPDISETSIAADFITVVFCRHDIMSVSFSAFTLSIFPVRRRSDYCYNYNPFRAFLHFVWDCPGELVPER